MDKILHFCTTVTIQRLVVALFLILLALVPSALSTSVSNALYEAYTGVTIFVILTIITVHLVEHRLQYDIKKLSQKKPYMSIIIATIMGSLPGCGGAIMVITWFNQNKIIFAAVISTLVATMGESAFVVIAQKPLSGLLTVIICFFTGIITGIIMYQIPILNLKPEKQTKNNTNDNTKQEPSLILTIVRTAWWIIAIPGIILGITRLLLITQITQLSMLFITIKIVGIIGAILSLIIWALDTISDSSLHQDSCNLKRIVEVDCSFITVWVIASYLFYDLFSHIIGLNVIQLFVTNNVYIIIAIALAVGFIPGCGPQIIVSQLYVNNVIPFAALVANAINNDGDALFPAIAKAPRAAIIATICSAIPAIIVGYGILMIFG